MRQLYLLRHGHSEANEKGLVTGVKDDALSLEGQEQARASAHLLRHCLPDNPLPVCFVSDWARAQETAALAWPQGSFITDLRLGETDAGTAATLTAGEFAAMAPDFWALFDPDRSYPEGESHKDLYDRVLAWLKEQEKALPPQATVLAVTHAGPIACLLHAVCKVSLAHFPMFFAAAASLTKLEKDKNNVWRL
ncbi:phosphoglycerate mutase family protein, partial [Desulfovibrio sp. OttesenSCG-928-M14]|nr:phosphoglycerate mutase family protein [Desulfovibrio sp. OttesenSCG-928-M14]